MFKITIVLDNLLVVLNNDEKELFWKRNVDINKIVFQNIIRSSSLDCVGPLLPPTYATSQKDVLFF